MLGFLFTRLYWYFRPLIKWFLRRTTKLCELQRICYGEPAGAPRCLALEFSILNSKSFYIKQFVRRLNEVCELRRFKKDYRRFLLIEGISTVCCDKNISPKIHPQFVEKFRGCLGQIWGYRQLVAEVEALRTTAYDVNNDEHENKLIELWNCLMPDEPLEARITKQWQSIGFQGDDPRTDFRGMGLLGLENLLYFAIFYEGPARHMLSHSSHPVYGYAFAVVGINLTSMAYNLLVDGTAKTHMFNITQYGPNMRVFHQLYSYLFYEFDRYWIDSKPKNIMDFSVIRERFETNVRAMLASPDVTLRVNISVDNI